MNEQPNNDNLVAEIGEAIKTMNAEEAKPTADKTTQVVEQPIEETVSTTEAPKEFVADDALIERAVKAGLSVADAKAFASSEQADRILKALESKKETPKTEAKETPNEADEGFPVGKFDEALAELENDKDEDGNPNYDPKVIGLVKEMGTLLKAQAKEIGALKKAGLSASAQTAFDTAFGGLDEGVRSHVDAATKSQLKSKFDFLKSAHESAKDGATDAEVFEEARKLVLGGIESGKAAEDKAAALAKRKSLTLARPGGESGQHGQDKPMSEVDIANALFNALTK